MSSPGMNYMRLGGVAGLIFVALGLVLFGVPMPPEGGASAAEIRTYYLDNRGAVLLQSAVTVFSLLPFLLFAVCIAGIVGEAGRPWSLLITVGVAGISINSMVATAAQAALAFRAGDSLASNEPALLTLFDFQSVLFSFIGVFGVAFLVGITLSGLFGGWMPRWLIWLGFLAAALEGISTPARLYVDVQILSLLAAPGFLLVTIFIVAVSVVMLRYRHTASA